MEHAKAAGDLDDARIDRAEEHAQRAVLVRSHARRRAARALAATGMVVKNGQQHDRVYVYAVHGIWPKH